MRRASVIGGSRDIRGTLRTHAVCCRCVRPAARVEVCETEATPKTEGRSLQSAPIGKWLATGAEERPRRNGKALTSGHYTGIAGPLRSATSQASGF